MDRRSQGTVYTHIENHIGNVEFGHPASNSLPTALLERIANAFEELSNAPEVRLIVLSSEEERAFCAGASFDEMVAVQTPEESIRFFSGFAKVLNAMRKCSKLIVGRIQGKVVGGGVGLVSACDYCFAVEAASLKLSELSISIGPFVIEPAIVRKSGLAAFSTMALNPTQWHTAYWAKDQGLYTRVFENISEMDKEIDFYVQKMATYSPEALARMKTLLWENTEHWETLLFERAKITGELALSKTTQQVIRRLKK